MCLHYLVKLIARVEGRKQTWSAAGLVAAVLGSSLLASVIGGLSAWGGHGGRRACRAHATSLGRSGSGGRRASSSTPGRRCVVTAVEWSGTLCRHAHVFRCVQTRLRRICLSTSIKQCRRSKGMIINVTVLILLAFSAYTIMELMSTSGAWVTLY